MGRRQHGEMVHGAEPTSFSKPPLSGAQDQGNDTLRREILEFQIRDGLRGLLRAPEEQKEAMKELLIRAMQENRHVLVDTDLQDANGLPSVFEKIMYLTNASSTSAVVRVAREILAHFQYFDDQFENSPRIERSGQKSEITGEASAHG